MVGNHADVTVDGWCATPVRCRSRGARRCRRDLRLRVLFAQLQTGTSAAACRCWTTTLTMGRRTFFVLSPWTALLSFVP